MPKKAVKSQNNHMNFGFSCRLYSCAHNKKVQQKPKRALLDSIPSHLVQFFFIFRNAFNTRCAAFLPGATVHWPQ